jgi:serine protease Do
MTRYLTVLAAAIAALAGAARAAPPPDARRVTPVVEVYRKSAPAVVNISTQMLVRTGPDLFAEEDPFEELIPRLFGPPVPMTSLGSGFLIHPDGYVVTNAHVVRRAQKITVTLADKSTYPAAVVAASADHDLAVLKVQDPKQRRFAFLPLGRSDDLMIGETVIAIGNPFGYQNTCSTGVISSLDRTLEFRGGTAYRGLIQTDAPINPGNSGGPLLNAAGGLIGINSAIRADAQGIGFAIPIDAFTRDLPGLLDFERINRVVCGLAVRQQHLDAGDELLVSAVVPQSPAARAGLKVGDRLLELEGKPLVQLPDYQVAMLAAKPAATVRLQCLREGKKVEATVKLEGRPKPDGAALAGRLLGLELREMTPDTARRLGLSADSGLPIAAVEPGGPAAQIGLRRNDVLFQLGRWYVNDLDGVGAVLEDVPPGQVLRIGIIRGNIRAWTSIQARRIDTAPEPPPRTRAQS